MTNKKPLHAYEQSMLLAVLLFDSKNINEILSFFPDEQRDKMNIAKNKFMNLPKNERLTQIVLELRRLILMDESQIHWIHQSWIDDALEKEPGYLRQIIEQALKEPPSKAVRDPHPLPVPRSFIFSSFMSQLSRSPQKLAIFDPVLMRLQSLKNEAQEEVFAFIGRITMAALVQAVPRERINRYVAKKDSLLVVSPGNFNPNPFEIAPMRRYLLRQLIGFNPTADANGLVFVGLVTTALYLSIYKYQWQRAIVLVLHKRLGGLLETLIHSAKNLNLERGHHTMLSSFLLVAFDQTRT